ncbi:hypothetical protein HUU53_02845 [Candidatus Micrarchaeota archaeon]|nr:hypothetical protein [Candidatus Micrarchaeota archaeon]
MAGPIESFQMRFSYNAEAKLEVAVWMGREVDGKALPSNISLRLQGFEKDSAYLNASDALELASMLQHYAVQVLKLDSERRLAAWKERQEKTDI